MDAGLPQPPLAPPRSRAARRAAAQRAECAATAALTVLGQKWVMRIVRELGHRTQRFCELQDALGGANSATLSQRLTVRSRAVYSTAAPDNLAQELAALRAEAATKAPLGYAFWSPSAIESFSAAGGYELPPGPVVLVGGSTLRCWQEIAPSQWRRAYRHDAETPLEWSLRFLERDTSAADGS